VDFGVDHDGKTPFARLRQPSAGAAWSTGRSSPWGAPRAATDEAATDPDGGVTGDETAAATDGGHVRGNVASA